MPHSHPFLCLLLGFANTTETTCGYRAGWRDSNGDDCDAYDDGKKTEEWCERAADWADAEGLDASEACCICREKIGTLGGESKSKRDTSDRRRARIKLRVPVFRTSADANRTYLLYLCSNR